MEIIYPNEIKTKYDWYDTHRKTWNEVFDKKKSINENTFCIACINSSTDYKPNEFKTIFERHLYYTFIDSLFSKSNMNMTKVSDIHFFKAASSVTHVLRIGILELPIMSNIFSKETVVILTVINKLLFEANMQIIKQILYRRIPFLFLFSNNTIIPDDAKLRPEISAFEFDIQMVRMEQSTVEAFIRDQTSRFTESVIEELNLMINADKKIADRFSTPFNLLGKGMDVIQDDITIKAKRALGIDKINFLVFKHRFALGIAYIFKFHGKSDNDYIKFIQES